MNALQKETKEGKRERGTVERNERRKKKENGKDTTGALQVTERGKKEWEMIEKRKNSGKERR